MLYVNKYSYIYIYILIVQNVFSKIKCQVSIFFFLNVNVGIKTKMGYYPLDRWCGVPNLDLIINLSKYLANSLG